VPETQLGKPRLGKALLGLNMSFPESSFPEIMEIGIGSRVNLGHGPKDLAFVRYFPTLGGIYITLSRPWQYRAIT